MLKFLALHEGHRICAHCNRVYPAGTYFYTEGMAGERYCSTSCYKGTRKVSSPKIRTTRERVREAIRLILGAGSGHCMPRAFDNCFEMGDGDAVAAGICRAARANPELRHRMTTIGYGEWLDKNPEPARQTNLFGELDSPHCARPAPADYCAYCLKPIPGDPLQGDHGSAYCGQNCLALGEQELADMRMEVAI